MQCDEEDDGCGGICPDECPLYTRGPPMKWNAAKNWCEERGATLATIKNKEEQHIAEQTCGGVNCWIGLTDQVVEGDWRWVDNTPLQEEETYWNPGEPNNWQAPEDCAIIWEDGLNIMKIPEKGKWADANCGWPIYTLCRNPQEDDNMQAEQLPALPELKVLNELVSEDRILRDIGHHDNHN